MNCNKYTPFIRQALKEDIGRRDITTELTISKDERSRAVLLAKEDLVVCGIDLAGEVFRQQDIGIRFKIAVKDGLSVRKGSVLARIEGKTSSIFAAERVALNFLGLLCGIATLTREYVLAVKPYKAKIMDTRKTIPGLRELEKYAVRTGGGVNHRMRLDEMVLLKDNHIRVTKSSGRKVTKLNDVIGHIRRKISKSVKIEVEAENLLQFRQALKAKPDIIMLDNMSIGNIKKAVSLMRAAHDRRHTTKLEASGGVTLKNVRKIAATGVDMISVGALTHSPKTADVSLESV